MNNYINNNNNNKNRTVGIKSVRIGDVVMEVYPPTNPELVPELQGPFYEGAQVLLSIWIYAYYYFITDKNNLLGYLEAFEMDHAKRQGIQS